MIGLQCYQISLFLSPWSLSSLCVGVQKQRCAATLSDLWRQNSRTDLARWLAGPFLFATNSHLVMRQWWGIKNLHKQKCIWSSLFCPIVTISLLHQINYSCSAAIIYSLKLWKVNWTEEGYSWAAAELRESKTTSLFSTTLLCYIFKVKSYIFYKIIGLGYNHIDHEATGHFTPPIFVTSYHRGLWKSYLVEIGAASLRIKSVFLEKCVHTQKIC